MCMPTPRHRLSSLNTSAYIDMHRFSRIGPVCSPISGWDSPPEWNKNRGPKSLSHAAPNQKGRENLGGDTTTTPPPTPAVAAAAAITTATTTATTAAAIAPPPPPRLLLLLLLLLLVVLLVLLRLRLRRRRRLLHY